MKDLIIRQLHYFFPGCLTLLLLSCSPVVNKYRSNPDVLAWEKDIENFEHLDSLETDPEHAILFTGSSSIRFWSTISEDMAPLPVIRRGYGGAKFDDFAVYSKRIIYPHKFDALAIFVANDIIGGKDDKDPEEVRKLFAYVVKQVRDKYKTQPIFFIEITPTRARWNAWNKIKEANTVIENWCDKKDNVYFIETAHAFLDENGQPKEELFREDKLHLNEKGYDVWAGILKENISKVLKSH